MGHERRNTTFAKGEGSSLTSERRGSFQAQGVSRTPGQCHRTSTCTPTMMTFYSSLVPVLCPNAATFARGHRAL
jgi:hypothetical protein